MTPHYKDCEIFVQRTCKFLRIYSVYMYVCMYVSIHCHDSYVSLWTCAYHTSVERIDNIQLGQY